MRFYAQAEYQLRVLNMIYLLHFTLNTTPPPDHKPLPNHAAAVAMESSGKSNNFVDWNKQ